MAVPGLSRAAVIVLLLALVACAGGTDGAAGGSSVPSTAHSSTSSGQTGSTGIPTVPATEPTREQTGRLEQPQRPASEQPAVEVAGLPVGGDVDVSATVPTALCVHVNWILQQTENTIPAGVSVHLRGATFTPAVFQASAHGCDGVRVAPSCEQQVLAATRLRCDISVEPTFAALPVDGSEGEGSMSLAGSVQCQDARSQTCRSFLQEVQQEAQTITVPVPRPAGTSTEPSTSVPPQGTPGSGVGGTTTSTTPAVPASSAPGG